jgi:rhomboid protease GluP
LIKIEPVLGRKRTGSVLCSSCGVLVGVNDDICYNCGRRNPALWGYAPLLRALGRDTGFMPFLFGLCFVMYGLTLVTSGSAILQGGLNFLGPDERALMIFGASGGLPVFGYKRWWTVLSAGWLHGGILHIAFNMLALRQLGPSTAHLYGAARMVIIYTAGAIAGFALSSISSVYFPAIPLIGGGQPNLTVGASCSLAGLIGAHVHYGRRSGSRMISDVSWQWAISMLVFGVVIQGIDNYGHIGGFIGGYAASQWLDPLKAERGDHIVAALLCLAASVAAILYSAIPLLIALNR